MMKSTAVFFAASICVLVGCIQSARAQEVKPVEAAVSSSSTTQELSPDDIKALILGKKVRFLFEGTPVVWAVKDDGHITGTWAGRSDSTMKPLYLKEGRLCSQWRKWNDVCPLIIARKDGKLWMTIWTGTGEELELVVSEN